LHGTGAIEAEGIRTIWEAEEYLKDKPDDETATEPNGNATEPPSTATVKVAKPAKTPRHKLEDRIYKSRIQLTAAESVIRHNDDWVLDPHLVGMIEGMRQDADLERSLADALEKKAKRET
jgi:hypothetical protein